MGNKKGLGRLAGAIAGKGFYIVLFLCAAVVGASVWTLSAGTHVEESETAEHKVDISDAVVTMLPAGTAREEASVPVAAMRPENEAEETSAAEEESSEENTWQDDSDAVMTYVWPVQGQIETPYAVETLTYDATMADWRAHAGIDIACTAGEQVVAAAAGTVVSVEDDDLLGTTVVIDHENGVHPPVSEDDWVTMGQVIGSVGKTALAETNMVPHLHLAMTEDGSYVDPRELLPTIEG